MRWRESRQSDNIEDRRGEPGRRRGPMMAGAGGGLGLLVIILVAAFLGVDPRPLLQQMGNPQIGVPAPGPAPGRAPALDEREEDELKEFVASVLGDTEDVWRELFRKMGKQYRDPTLVLFAGQVDSACGFASAAVGPFYCPGDQKVYLDLGFFDELNDRFGAPGDFAQAYVIAHEIGHHVQNQLGITQRVDAMRGRVSEEEYNRLSVRLELQADFFAGVWAYHANRMRKLLEAGDVDEALRAATAIGDDAIQRKTQGYVVPDSFTHGTSEQRKRWFKKGLQTGDMNQGDTFNAREL